MSRPSIRTDPQVSDRHPSPPSPWSRGLAALFPSLIASLLLGCTPSSSSPGLPPLTAPPVSDVNLDLAKGALAAIEIRNQSPAAVRQTVESVFTDAGLALSLRRPDQLVFERPASRAERRAYGNWQGDDLRVRLRVEFIELGPSLTFVRCLSFLVRDPDSAYQDEQSLARRRVRQYEGLLTEVSLRLN
ncbi:MAG: hypothetical protein KF833_14950 [Verrucomicrobiae bacterium]|nr:hypothetical protein [Verrucomicrobiae bacterium]